MKVGQFVDLEFDLSKDEYPAPNIPYEKRGDRADEILQP